MNFSYIKCTFVIFRLENFWFVWTLYFYDSYFFSYICNFIKKYNVSKFLFSSYMYIFKLFEIYIFYMTCRHIRLSKICLIFAFPYYPLSRNYSVLWINLKFDEYPKIFITNFSHDRFIKTAWNNSHFNHHGSRPIYKTIINSTIEIISGHTIVPTTEFYYFFCPIS